MTPQEWKLLLFKQHRQRLATLSIPSAADGQQRDARSTPHPVFTITTGDDDVSESDDGVGAGGSGPLGTFFPDDASETVDDSNGVIDGVMHEGAKALPETLEETLEDIDERRLLYLTFRNDSEDLIFRVTIFGTLKKLVSTLNATHPPPANRDLVKRQIKAALALESAIDLINTLLIDVEAWSRDEDLNQLACKLRARNAVELPEEEDREEVDELIVMSDKIMNDLLSLPFHNPRAVDDDRLTSYIADVRSRSDGYCLLLSQLEEQANKIVKQKRLFQDRRKSMAMPLSAMTGSHVKERGG
ncbi:hypothetical protein HK101_004913, partial [Irineochytrium annulatum]